MRPLAVPHPPDDLGERRCGASFGLLVRGTGDKLLPRLSSHGGESKMESTSSRQVDVLNGESAVGPRELLEHRKGKGKERKGRGGGAVL